MSAYTPLSRRKLLLGGIAAVLSLPALAGAARASKILLRRFAAAPFIVPRTRRVTRIALNIASVRNRLTSVALSRDSTLLLHLGGMRVARPPGVVWRVYLAPPGTSARARKDYFVGSVALFSDGVGTTARAAHADFVVDQAILHALPLTTDTLELGFVPTGPLVNGRPTSPLPAAALRVGDLSAWVQRL